MRIMASLVEQKVRTGFNMGDFAMKMRNYFFAAAAIVLAASCVKENPAQDNGQVAVNYVPMEFTSAVETKTELSEGKVKWLEGDQISIFDNSASAETHNNLFETTGDGSFSGTVPEDATGFYALYPYNESASNASDTVRFTLPAIQPAKAGTFADDLAIMVAKSADGTLAFKNICSHIKFTLAEDLTDVKSITLMGNKAEILSGGCSVKWNDGDLKVFVADTKNSETYVTLRNEDGSPLVPGDYYFTILPVTFSEGFTVILSKTDGSQVAKKTSAANDKVATRNKILVMKPLASSEYVDHLNYFVKYNDGFDLTFGGVTINNETHPGGILASDNKRLSWNTAVNPTGVFFVDPNCTKASINKTQAFESIAVIGADSSKKSSLIFTKVARFKDGGSLLLLANLACDVKSNNGFVQHSEAQVTKFGNIVLSGCHFRNMTKNLFEFKLYNITKMNICMENTDFAFGAGSIFLVNFGSMSSTIDNIIFKNNVYYSKAGTQVSDCKLVGGDNTIVKNAVSANGTYDKILIPNAGFYRIASCETVDFSSNIFVDCNADDVKGNFMSLRNGANLDKTAVTGNIVNNYSYTTTTGSMLTGMSSKEYTGATIYSPNTFETYPLSSSWNPANEVYGAYILSDGVSKTIGAQRPDMTPAPNSASYRYPATDLGTF